MRVHEGNMRVEWSQKKLYEVAMKNLFIFYKLVQVVLDL